MQNDFVTRMELASTYIGTPDPRRTQPYYGQRLTTYWQVPHSYLVDHELKIKARVRFRNNTETTYMFPVNRSRGHHIYTLLNEPYLETKGILTYKAELISNGEVLEAWHHQIWAEWIDPATDDEIAAPLFELDE